MHRRRFARVLGGALCAPFWACRRGEPDLQAIGRLLGLERSELSWLDALPPAAQRELRAALEQPAEGNIDRAVAHTFAVMGHRSRTFAFVGYPAVNDRRSVCDGLLPE
jgi:hypothetical protein